MSKYRWRIFHLGNPLSGKYLGYETFLSNVSVQHFSCLLDRYHSSPNVVYDPDLTAMAIVNRPQ